jgi:hypothetical protein
MTVILAEEVELALEHAVARHVWMVNGTEAKDSLTQNNK